MLLPEQRNTTKKAPHKINNLHRFYLKTVSYNPEKRLKKVQKKLAIPNMPLLK